MENQAAATTTEQVVDEQVIAQETKQPDHEGLVQKHMVRAGVGEFEDVVLNEPSPAPEPEPTPEPVEATPEPAPSPQVSVEEFEKIKKQLADKESFIQKQANDFGEAKKKLQELQSKLADNHPDVVAAKQALVDDFGQEVVDRMFDSFRTVSAAEQRAEFDKMLAEREQSIQAEIEASNAFIAKNAEVLNGTFSNYKELVPTMAELAEKELGATPEQLAAFKQNPYAFDTTTLFQLAHKASVKTMQENLAPENIAKKVAEAANGKGLNGLNGNASTPPAKKVYTAAELARMPKEQYEKYKSRFMTRQ